MDTNKRGKRQGTNNPTWMDRRKKEILFILSIHVK
jgi:hypothetical protein